MIIVNGVPRTGTHLVKKFLGMLALRDSGHVFLSLSEREPLRARVLLSEDEKRVTSVPSALAFDDEYFAHGHIHQNWRNALSDHKVITTFRDPRDSAVSIIQWHEYRGKLQEGHSRADENCLLDLLKHGYYASRRDRSWVRFVRGFLEWKKAGLVLEFDTLGTVTAARAIAEFVGYPVPPLRLKGMVKGWKGNGKIWNNKPMHISMSSQHPSKASRWQDWWSPKVQKVWEETDGPKLLEDMGYE